MHFLYRAIIAGIVFFGTLFGGLALYENYLEQNDSVRALPEQENSNIIVPENTESIPKNVEFQCKGDKLCLVEEITRIIDGDTLYLEGGYKIRLSLTNTPERIEKGFFEANQFTSELCSVGTIAVVDQDDLQPYDVYDRILGKVVCGGNVLNAELLYADHANILTRYCSTSEFSDERWAQEFGC